MIRMGAVITLLALVVLYAGNAAAQSSPSEIATVLSTADAKKRELLNEEVLLRGTVQNYVPPTSDRAPHKLVLKDAQGSIRLAIWNDVWSDIPFRDKLRETPGPQITARVKLREFKNEIEGHLLAAGDVKEGSSIPPALGPVAWLYDIPQALASASRDRKSILVFFSSSTGETSQYLEQTVFTDKRIREALARRYVAARMDVTAQPDAAARYGVHRGGTVVLYRSDGTFLKSFQTIRRVEDLLKEL